MFTFALFRMCNPPAPNLMDLEGTWSLPGGIVVDVRAERLGPIEGFTEGYPYSGQERILLTIRSVNESDVFPPRCLVTVGFLSGLVLADTGGSIGLADTIIDAMADRMGVAVESLDPPVESLVEFIKEGSILRLLVATPYGLADLSQKQGIDWSGLNTTPFVSASIEYDHEGPFEVRVGRAILSIYEEGTVSRVEFITQLVEKHFLRRVNQIESSAAC